MGHSQSASKHTSRSQHSQKRSTDRPASFYAPENSNWNPDDKSANPSCDGASDVIDCKPIQAPPSYSDAIHRQAGSRSGHPNANTWRPPPKRFLEVQQHAPWLDESESEFENALEQLRLYDTVVVVDDSSSMAGWLWKEVRDVLASIVHRAAKYDADGIDIHFLNDKRVGRNMREAQEIMELFETVQPKGITPTARKLEQLLFEYMTKLNRTKPAYDAGNADALSKPVNFIVLTDGAPTDDPETVINRYARKLDDGNYPITQVGIQFVQIGDDPRAVLALRELDDDLRNKHDVRDMVDTVLSGGHTLTAGRLVKVLLGGINRRVDKATGSSVIYF